VKVACLVAFGRRRYQRVARAMAEGIAKCGDQPVIYPVAGVPRADVAVMYGWKLSQHYRKYPQFVYADLGFWGRDTYYRVTVNGWSPERYVKAGLPDTRFRALGVEIQPWREAGDEVLIVGSSRKSAVQHGYEYMEWETKVAQQLKDCGKRVVYRPKPTDPERRPIPGVGYDEGPLEGSLAKAWAVVTHHSNAAVKALAAGVPVHCATGAAAAFSFPLDRIADPPLLEGREQFLYDVAWLQWTIEEMESGACWAHLKERGLICEPSTL
jgi:hypothetical protein